MLSDHQEVYERLVGVSVKWRDLGGALGLDQNTLSSMDAKYARNALEATTIRWSSQL